ncbi:type II toxin-antitoxin system HigB family toxin [Deinococcus cavernae]|uniref:Type II toxin-antitoxin system HigB family toxin n=1 Tax=Deinococcus cavernae TaxID=2320857 RepID=A0A418VEC4_9DEIO|nr:type II toxin-antitoxin system HigB family toxin [Deinococcus cavernae]RJF74428.1 type II toxin-antitoxin system HigB family toxin [Deinococcus cavernae]
MNVLARPRLNQFIEEFPEAREPLERWYVICKKNDFANLHELQETFSDVSFVAPDYFIFNIKGGNFRLITTVSFQYKVIRLKEFMRHDDYNNWKP